MDKLITIFVLALTPAFCHALDLEARPLNLTEDSEFLVNFRDPELLEKGERKWMRKSDSNILECNLSIRSHYDQELAKKLGSAVYRMRQINGGSSIGYLINEARDHFSLWLTTENKDLPLMLLDCFKSQRGPAPQSRLTFADVIGLTGLKDFFLKPVVSLSPAKAASELLPKASTAIVRYDLHFVAIASGSGLSIVEQPMIENGVLVKRGGPLPGCSVSYSSSPGDMKPYDITIPAGTEFRVQALNENRSFNILALNSLKDNSRISLSCFFKEAQSPQNFSEFRKILDNAIDIK